MSECYEKFTKLKKNMDNKVFVYDKKQPWERDIEKCINNNDFLKSFNIFFLIKIN
jgi:hypothetical protein